jgi:hypothetical protein
MVDQAAFSDLMLDYIGREFPLPPEDSLITYHRLEIAQEVLMPMAVDALDNIPSAFYKAIKLLVEDITKRNAPGCGIVTSGWTIMLSPKNMLNTSTGYDAPGIYCNRDGVHVVRAQCLVGASYTVNSSTDKGAKHEDNPRRDQADQAGQA